MCILISFSLFSQASAVNVDVDLEWKVSVGNSKTYTVSELFEEADLDGNGDPTTVKKTVIDINNNTVEVVLMKGSTLTVEVIALNKSAFIQVTYNKNVTAKTRLDTGIFLQKTTEDWAYWEQVAKENSGCKVNGDLFILKQTINGIDSVKKYNMTSGWLEYSHQSHEASVSEFSAIEYQANTTSYDLLFSLLSIPFLAIITRKMMSYRK
ncbi:MAG: hypothetical protein ACXAD7_25625 [Candidatus Kariarchaeaceae archaeon]|jgi:hypothetical protein